MGEGSGSVLRKKRVIVCFRVGGIPKCVLCGVETICFDTRRRYVCPECDVTYWVIDLEEV